MKVSTKIFFISLLFFLIAFFGYSQVTPPSLRCISVEGNQIKLDWVISNDPLGEFTSYEIHSSINGGVSFGAGPIATINSRIQNSYTHVGAGFGGVSTSHMYYIVAWYNDGTAKKTSNSDTLQVISPTLVVNQNVSGKLDWNPIHLPKLVSSAGNYEVDRRFTGTPPVWSNAIASPNVGVEQFIDNVARCNDQVYYKVRLADNSGCESVSAIVREALIDNSGPTPMGFSSISVNKEFGYTELFWDKHPDRSTSGYIIFYVDANGSAISIANVDSNTVSFKDIDPSRSAFLASQCYRIAPEDSCGFTQGASETHCTMHLTRSFDPCEGEVSLNWTAYEGWVNGTVKHEIYMSINNGPFTLKGEVDGNTNSYVISDISAINTYSFYITAFSAVGGHSSNSNLLGTKFQIANKSEYIRLRSASVNESGTVNVNFLVDRKAEFDHIALYRSHNLDGPFQKLQKFIPNSKTETFLTIEDTIPLENHIKAYYYAMVIDECGKPIVKSEVVSTMFLEAKGDKFDFNTELNWNSTNVNDTFEEENFSYYAYYGLNRQLQANHFASSRGATELEHLFESDAIYSNEFCYRIEMVLGATEFYNKEDISYSNMECFYFEPEVNIPNAFSPNIDGINEVWKPEIIYGEGGSGYLLQIFDKWGKVIFETDDPNEGWDGTYNSIPSPIGSYVYKFKILTYHESEINRKGSFSLIR